MKFSPVIFFCLVAASIAAPARASILYVDQVWDEEELTLTANSVVGSRATDYGTTQEIWFRLDDEAIANWPHAWPIESWEGNVLERGVDPITCREPLDPSSCTGGAWERSQWVFWPMTIYQREDLDADGIVDAADAGLLFADWGKSFGTSDLTNDGIVDEADAGAMFAEWTTADEAVPVPEPRAAAVACILIYLSIWAVSRQNAKSAV